jgi:hypothetical protein
MKGQFETEVEHYETTIYKLYDARLRYNIEQTICG